jgi:hypothetical protein
MVKRNYKREYKLFHSLPLQKRRRAGRNNARRKMLRLGKVRKFSNSDVDHKNHDVFDNRISNLRVISKYKNRSIK